MKAPSPHGRGGSQIRFRIAPDLLDRIQQDAASSGRTMNAEIVRLIEKGLEPPSVATPAPSSPAPSRGWGNASLPHPAGQQGELFALPDLDALERLVGVVERTNRIFGASAARRLWPMLGLPDLRTSEDEPGGTDARRSGKAGEKAGRATEGPIGVRGPESGGETPPPSAPRKQALFRPWVARFIQECCEPEPKAVLRAVVFREAYMRWAVAKGAPMLIPALLGRYAVGLGLRKHKSMGGTVYLDLRLKPPAELLQASDA